ncbi:Hypothetical protein, putative [Bodo saltans]|uniref:Uncharacterized protein n=1 Tax=Bodo saltans TaxID=75058 RepID=A0A0S4IXJ5_BODSA|nr:Hypothetical protein, putative [Bodo saltans]|eukprot:CUG06400.1 Hypothetical protein, putative [Bodo saltans]
MLARSLGRLSAAHRRAVAIKMSEAKVSGDVPVPSFVFHLLQRNPSIRELRLDERMQLLLGEWRKLSLESKKEFEASPLKGLL